MVYFNIKEIEDLKVVLYREFYFRNIDRHGGRTSSDYWSECVPYVERRLREILSKYDKKEKIPEFDPTYLKRLEEERKLNLERKVKEEIRDPRPVTPSIPDVPKPEKKRRFYLFGRRKQRDKDNKG